VDQIQDVTRERHVVTRFHCFILFYFIFEKKALFNNWVSYKKSPKAPPDVFCFQCHPSLLRVEIAWLPFATSCATSQAVE